MHIHGDNSIEGNGGSINHSNSTRAKKVPESQLSHADSEQTQLSRSPDGFCYSVLHFPTYSYTNENS